MVAPEDLAKDQANVVAPVQAATAGVSDRNTGHASFLACGASSPKSSTPPAILLGGNVNGLGALRSLARHGIRPIVITGSKLDPILRSRYSWKRHVVDPLTDSALLSVLGHYRDQRAVLIATSDHFASFLATHESLLRKSFHLLLPPNRIVELLVDKRTETEAIREIGVPIPKTIGKMPSTASQLIDLIELPLLIKPRSDPDRRIIQQKNCVIQSHEQLDAFYERYINHLDRFIAQEIIPGDDENLWICLCVFDHRSRLLQAFTFYRLGCSPPHYGVTSFAVSETNKQITQYAETIGRSLQYSGVASIEFKLDERDQTYKYIEANPRLGMCNFFGAYCGINNTALSYHLALDDNYGRNLNRMTNSYERQKDGVVFIDFQQDLSARLADGEAWSKILFRYMKYLLRRRASAYWYWLDPLPALYLLSRGVLRRLATGR